MKRFIVTLYTFVLGMLRLPNTLAECAEALTVCIVQTVNLFQGDVLAAVKCACNAMVAFQARQMHESPAHREAAKELLSRVAKANHCTGFVKGPQPVTDADRKRLGLTPIEGGATDRKLDS